MKTIIFITLAASSIGCSPKGEVPAITKVAATTELTSPTQQHFEDFSDADGAYKTQENGAPEEVFGELKNLIYSYGKVSDGTDGNIQLAIHEDNLSFGHDGRPGVLRFDITDLSGPIDHFGAIYIGDTDGTQIRIESWKGKELSADSLSGTYLEFRYRAENRKDESKIGATYNVRFEPEIDDSWINRIDFGSINANGKWQIFAKSLAEGTNQPAFLQTMSDVKPTRFKLVWGQDGPGSNYQPGDSLLIDDIRITTHE
jgi:hypothetical protein